MKNNQKYKKHERVEEWEKRTGQKYGDYEGIWISPFGIEWEVMPYLMAIYRMELFKKHNYPVVMLVYERDFQPEPKTFSSYLTTEELEIVKKM